MLSYKAFHLKHFAHSPEHLEVKAFKFEHATLTLYFEGQPFLRHTAGHGISFFYTLCRKNYITTGCPKKSPFRNQSIVIIINSRYAFWI